ncbi:DUF2777 domain-containing protein [Bacillus sp. PS06]|uniref:DUF2777 domain-containing protein n=1 Tax=Bacillus sp. PS06 TaxID=2764176 RepID=UPI00177C0AB8|nr:DUF2777 domain-containing protein [Bacillus sp. PS06]MBD8067586.1 DUF2777 domain-containing protein [Bacillus sp. PS06]
MNLQHRLRTLSEQKRAYTLGSVEYINDQWIFFDDENEEASLLEELVDREIDVFTMNAWQRGMFTADGLVKMADYYYKLEHGDCIRVSKTLPYAYSELLNQLPDHLFMEYTKFLNKLSYSLYDCIYCHNLMLYVPTDRHYKGVNFITYDNNETICAVQHHFERGIHTKDRFEFTIANGTRAVFTHT